MLPNMDKRDRAALFRDRLSSVMTAKGVSRSELARRTGVDRSTVGQLLNAAAPRLPNAQLAADIAQTMTTSTDWLLGLTDRPERPGDIVASALSLSPAKRSSADSQLMDWHREARGYKIRHVPATLPDMLKTPEFIDWEYVTHRPSGSSEALQALRDQQDWLHSGDSDLEIALPLHELDACAAGTGYYAGLPRSLRAAQLQRIADSAHALYPRLRLFLFDAHTVFSAPVTVFGPGLAVIYVGKFYLTFREVERIRIVSDHFDWLIREAVVDGRDIPDHIRCLPVA